MERVAPHVLANPAARGVVNWRVNATPHPTQGAFVGGIHERGPLQVEGHTWPVLKHQKLLCLRRPFGEPSGPVGRSGQQLEQLCGGPRVGAVPTDVAGKWWGHKTRPLVGPPALGQNPIDPCFVNDGELDVVRALPTTDLHFAHLVFVVKEVQGIRVVHHLNPTRNERQTRRVVIGQIGVGTLAVLGHVPNGRHRAGVVVIALGTPSGDGAVVHGPTEGEVRLHIELQIVDQRPLPSPAVLTRLTVEDEFIEQGVPVTGRRL